MSQDIEFNDKQLKKLIKIFKAASPQAHVGVLGAKNARIDPNAENSNAVIGAKHEFGYEGLPIRSWLRMPLITYLPKELEKAGTFSKDAIASVLKEGSFLTFVKKIGVLAERVIAIGFDTGGYGQWKPSIMAFKNNKQTLVESQQLRNSVTSEVR